MLPIMAPPDDTCDLWLIGAESLDSKVDRAVPHGWSQNRVSSG